MTKSLFPFLPTHHPVLSPNSALRAYEASDVSSYTIQKIPNARDRTQVIAMALAGKACLVDQKGNSVSISSRLDKVLSDTIAELGCLLEGYYVRANAHNIEQFYITDCILSDAINSSSHERQGLLLELDGIISRQGPLQSINLIVITGEEFHDISALSEKASCALLVKSSHSSATYSFGCISRTSCMVVSENLNDINTIED